MHASASVAISLGERMYLRPDLRLRWIDGFGDSGIDVETTLALGWRIGRKR